MAVLSLNNANGTIVIHKDNCKEVQKLNVNLTQHSNGYSNGKNQLWFDETNFNISKAQNFFNGRDYCSRFCSNCF